MSEVGRMKEFDVTITETLKLTVSVEASSKEEAQQMVSDQWHAGDHILDADNFVEVEAVVNIDGLFLLAVLACVFLVNDNLLN